MRRKTDAEAQSAGRVMTVMTRRHGLTFHRAGIKFGPEPVVIRERMDGGSDAYDPFADRADVCPSTFDRILGEHMLICTLEKTDQ